jgi:hypothetical protein
MTLSFRRRGILPARAAVLIAACSAFIALAPAAASAETTAPPCPHRSGRVVCVDQDHQLMWVQQGAQTIFPPVLVRTGYRGMWTPNGNFHIYVRHAWPTSPLLPYSQFFYRGYALHGSRDDLHKGKSKGCVNMSVDNARRLWKVLSVGDLVHIWGHKPGT